MVPPRLYLIALVKRTQIVREGAHLLRPAQSAQNTKWPAPPMRGIRPQHRMLLPSSPLALPTPCSLLALAPPFCCIHLISGLHTATPPGRPLLYPLMPPTFGSLTRSIVDPEESAQLTTLRACRAHTLRCNPHRPSPLSICTLIPFLDMEPRPSHIRLVLVSILLRELQKIAHAYTDRTGSSPPPSSPIHLCCPLAALSHPPHLDCHLQPLGLSEPCTDPDSSRHPCTSCFFSSHTHL